MNRTDFPRLRRRSALAAIALAAVAATACGSSSTSSSGSSGSSSSPVTLTVAVVDNPQLTDLQSMTKTVYEKMYPNVTVKFVTLTEDTLRQAVTQDVASHAGKYDVVAVGPYDVSSAYAPNGWLVDLQSYLNSDSSYDESDLISGIANSLKYKGDLYALPMYGESSFVMYRKDLFQAAGLTMPTNPTWDQIESFAKALNNPSQGVAGICLRGVNGWGENLAALDTVINAFGGSWFDSSWNAQLTSAADTSAVNFYVNLVKQYGEPGAANDGFTECNNAYQQGKAAMWYDATVGASNLTGSVAQNTGYAYAPTEDASLQHTGWLWSWALAVEFGKQEPERCRAVHHLGHLEAVHPVYRPGYGRQPHPARDPHIDLLDVRVSADRQLLRTAGAQLDQQRRHQPLLRELGTVLRHPVREHPTVRDPR